MPQQRIDTRESGVSRALAPEGRGEQSSVGRGSPEPRVRTKSWLLLEERSQAGQVLGQRERSRALLPVGKALRSIKNAVFSGDHSAENVLGLQTK